MTVSDIFATMDYGTAPENASEALAWIVDQGSHFGHFIDGTMTPVGEAFESRNPANGEILAHITQGTQADVDAAVKAARRNGQPQAGMRVQRFSMPSRACCKNTAACSP